MRCEEEDELCFRRRHAVNKLIVVVNVNLSVRWVKHIPCSSNLQHPYECSLKFYQRYLVEYLITSLEHNARNSYFALLGPGAYPNSKKLHNFKFWRLQCWQSKRVGPSWRQRRSWIMTVLLLMLAQHSWAIGACAVCYAESNPVWKGDELT